MADINYSVAVDSAGAEANLRKLKGEVAATGSAFKGLGSIISGLAIGTFIGQSFKMAAQIADLGKASGFATAQILGLGKAFSVNGGSAEGAQKSLGRFAKSVEDALGGGKLAIEQFASLGITIDDLQNKSDQDIYRKTITGLGEMGAGAVRTATAMALLGKEASTVDFTGVNEGLDDFVAKSAGAGDAIDAAGEANDAMTEAMQNLSTAIVIALQPLSEFVISMSDSSEELGRFLKNLLTVIAAIAGFLLIGKVFTTIKGLIVGLGKAWTSLGTTFGSIATQWRALVKGIDAGKGIFGELGTFIYTLATKRIPYLLSAFSAVGVFVKENFGAVVASMVSVWAAASALYYQVKGLFGGEDPNKPKVSSAKQKAADAKRAAEEDAAAKQLALKKALYEQSLADERKKTADELQKVTRRELDSINATVAAYRQSTSEREKGLKYSIESLKLSEKEKAVIDAKAGAENDYLQEITRLQAHYDSIKQSGNAAELAQLPKIMNAMNLLSTEYALHAARVGELAAAYSDAQAARNVELFQLSEQIKLSNDLMKVQDDIAKMTMTEIEQKYYDIDAAARNSAKAAIEAEEARRNAALKPEEVKAYYDAAYKGAEKLKKATKEQYDASRSFSTGWKKAFNEYAANASNAAKSAERIFSKATQGMEDALVGFAKTGKFEWKDFLATMLEELLRSQIQQLFSSMMGNMQGSMQGVTQGGSSGLLGSIGGLFGGGQQQQQSSSGGWGDILGSIGGLFGGQTQQQQQLNDQWSEPSVWGGIGDAVSSAWGGITDFFGGFFAQGGQLGAGKWGIAGENGPELIKGPANVVPNGFGGSTNVYYTINATDAMSFKQMLAADPSFVYALTMQGGKGMPGR